ncbi:MAG TPA: helix-turn-helix domain-containing protein, partial [Burkholderiaceae bacterium]|nr:helix-turn-helix domain-containing protein [Burkholderiaceae bacterium]
MLLLKLVHGLASWLIAQPIPLRQASFGFAQRETVADCAALFPGPAHFDRDYTGLNFDAALLDLPLRRSRREIRSFVARTPYDWLFPTGLPPLIERLRHHLSANLQAPAGELDQVAHAMHMSVRTLTRRLRAQGTSFQAIKDQVRCELATERLRLSADPVAAIGEEMGFDDPVSFFRAFRRWTGTTPAAYRAQRRS